jgi:Domain of unknown function (DUF1929)./Glyoxal oxidase N-terminus.
VLPSGKVMSYGTDERGQQGAQFNYEVWDPELGTELDAHTLLPNTTSVDLFCAAQSIIPSTGEVLITGGDRTYNGLRNYSENATNIFNENAPDSEKLRLDDQMADARWYPSLVTMPNGELVVIGGRSDQLPNVTAETPERYTPGSGWTRLTGVPHGGITQNNWYYPRAWVAPNGLIFWLAYDGSMRYLDPSGVGKFIELPTRTLRGTSSFPAIMYAPGKVLAVRNDQQVVQIDVNGAAPVVTPQPNTDQIRLWSTLTVMADGKVLLNGGSVEYNILSGAAYKVEIWDPTTGQWTIGATAAKPRLYHSIGLLLPDATVLTAAGGSPGPVTNLNAEIYFPPYLYKNDGSGQPATRPEIIASWSSAKLGDYQWFVVKPDHGVPVPVNRVTLVRLGSVTHTYNSEARILDAEIVEVRDRAYRIKLPSDPNRAVPGFYMMFVFNEAGTPSVSKIIRLSS